MTKMLANRVSIAVAATLFVAATFMSASSADRSAPTTIVLSNPAQSFGNIASNR